MSDETPRPDAGKAEDADTTAAVPTAAASGPATEPQPEPVAAPAAVPVAAPAAAAPVAAVPAPAAGHWWNRRVPLVIIGVALLLGCVLGAGVTAVGALVGSAWHGDDRGHGTRDDRFGGRNNGNGNGPGRFDRGNRQNRNNAPGPATSIAPVPTAPAPTASS